MDWYEKLVGICKKNNAEALRGPDGVLYIVCDKELNKKTKDSIATNLPQDMACKYVEGVKPSSLYALKQALSKVLEMGYAQPFQEGRDLKINVTGSLVEDPDWESINRALMDDGFCAKWSVNVNGQDVYSKTRSDMAIQKEVIQNQSVRDKILTDDDILNVKITLANAKTIDDLINSL